MADIVLSVASKAVECLLAPIGRQCGYVIFSDRYIGKLTGELEQLKGARQRVQHSVDEAQNNMKQIEADVKEWVEKVETIVNKAHDILDYDGRAKKTCFYGWLPNPKERYCLARGARKTVQAIQELRQVKFKRVYYESAPPGHVAGAPNVNSSAGDGGDTITNSQASIFQGIMKAVDDEMLKVIGVYGPGGVGKTTLLEKVEKKLRKEGRPFHMIIKAKVSQTPELKKIQDDIAYALSLDLKNEPSEVGRRDLLFRKLQSDPTKKVLIILDDLWDKLDLKAVGIPSGAESRGCKLLLSSRFKDVLEQKMLADRTFHLEGLSNDEAFRLFEKIVGDRLKDEELKRIAAEVVKKLAGLPLLITSVASTLKCGNVSAWKNALIKIEEKKMEAIVKLSYDHLESEDAKSLFLLCGLIGGTIRVEILLVLGMGLGLFEGFNNTIEDSRDRLNTRLDELRSACLLLDGGDDKDNVTIHDLYSEIAVSTPFRGHNSLMMNSNYGLRSKEKLEKCWAICQVNVGSDALAELMRCRFPELKILMLSQPKAWDGRPAHRHDGQDCCRLDFTYMKELRVLYLGSMHITALPSSIEFLEKLQSLYLDHCNVGDVAILGKLKALQILSFAGSNISRLPQEIGELTNMRSLNLSNCYMLQTIEPGVLKCLVKLEELHMKGSFDRWVGKDKIPSQFCNPGLAELKSLTKIASLEISIRDPTKLLEDDDLPFENLIRFWINIGNAYGRTLGGLRTMKLKLGGCDSILSKEWLQKTLQNTQYLHLDGLKEFKKNAHELCTQGFRELKHLDINNSPSIKYIANSSDGLPLTAFTILESLFLKNLISLEKICNGPIAPVCFSKLKAVSIEECRRLKNLWFLSEMQRLVHLEELQVRDCSSMQAIVTSDAGKVEVADDDIVELPNVRSLDLRQLPNMTSFCTGAEGAPIQVSLPRLESLLMWGLLDLEEILYSEPSIKYSSLKSLLILESNSTSSILKLDSILKLPNLESMEICGCLPAEVVFDLEELKVTGDAEILSRLMKLKLYNMPNLRCMWKSNVQLQGISRFRNLETLHVSYTRLSFLFPVSVAKCLREIRVISVEYCPNMKAVIVDEEGRDEGTHDTMEFPQLKCLYIERCPIEKFLSYPHGKKESVTTTSDSQDAYSDSFFNPKVSLPSLETLDFYKVGSFKRIWHGDLPRSSFYKLATLTLTNCSELLNVFPSTIIGRLHNLKSVTVAYCPSLESLFDCGSLDANTEQTSVLLPKLEEVKVRGAGKLRSLVKSDSQIICGFPRLKVVVVENCDDMKYLFPHFTAATLEKLESIDIRQCEQMEEVVPKEEGGRSKADVMTFPSLRHLRILQCPNFGAFIRNPTSVKRQSGETAEKNDGSPQPLFNEMVTFPNIRSLEIKGLWCKELWNNQIPTDSFRKLEYLELENCDNLQRIAPSHMWKRLQCCLEILQVISCRSIEIIYEGDGKDTKSSKLRRLVLRYLENLRHIWQSDGLPNVPFPNLRYVQAVRCSHLKMLFPTFTAKFLGQIEELVVESCEDMELIAGHENWEEATGTTITFSKLTVLRLFELPKFRSFLPAKHSLKSPYSEDFPSLRDLSIVSCGAEPDRVTVDWESHQRQRLEHWHLESLERWPPIDFFSTFLFARSFS